MALGMLQEEVKIFLHILGEGLIQEIIKVVS
jgi:hypothetical protein